MQSNWLAPSASSASSPVPTAVVSTSPLPISSTMLLALRLVVLDDQQLLHPPLDEAAGCSTRASSSASLGHRLLRKAIAPCFSPRCCSSVDRDDVDRDVAGARVVLQAVEDRPAVHVRAADVERDGVGLELARQRQRRLAVGWRRCP